MLVSSQPAISQASDPDFHFSSSHVLHQPAPQPNPTGRKPSVQNLPPYSDSLSYGQILNVFSGVWILPIVTILAYAMYEGRWNPKMHLVAISSNCQKLQLLPFFYLLVSGQSPLR